MNKINSMSGCTWREGSIEERKREGRDGGVERGKEGGSEDGGRAGGR